jgi:hypothetical protein
VICLAYPKAQRFKGAKFVAFLCALASLRLCVELFLNLWVRIRIIQQFPLDDLVTH